jgi:membrane fusion protein, multidrug efflux system
MKKVIITLLAAATLVACEAPKDESQLGKLKQEKDSLKEVYTGIAKRMSELDFQISTLDTATEIRVPLVTVAPIKVKGFEHYFVVQGAVEADKNALVYPEVMGEIVSIRVQEGQAVNKGDVIMELDAKLVRSQIKELETSYAFVKDMYEKQEKLWNQKIGSEVQYLEAKNNKERMEQSMKTLKAQLDLYIVRAPFAGTVDEIVPKVGEAAAPQMPVARVVNLNQVYIKSDVSENYISSVKKGTTANVYFSSLDKSFVTSVNRSGDYINANNRTFKVRFDIDNGSGELIPNMLADISILDYALDSAVVIPTKIIQEDRQSNEYVYVMSKSGGESTVKKVVINTGMSYNGETVILKGLSGDEMYIDQGARSVQDGDIVEVAK